MTQISGIKEHMEVIGADGVRVGTVDRVEGDRIKLARKDSPDGQHHYLSTGLVAGVEGDRVRLSTTSANALMFREEDEGSQRLVTQGQGTHGQSTLSGSSSGGGTSTQGTSTQGTSTQSSFAQETSSQSSQPSTLGKRSKASGQGGSRNWKNIAIGTAAAATVAGTALLARRRKSDKADAKKFELRLQTDENVRLISSSKVEGTPVVGRNGESLGRIENFMVDKYTGRVAYAVLSFGGTFGLGESLFPLPWAILTYDEGKDGYVLDLTKEQLERAPKFKPSDAPEFSADYRRSVARAYAY